MPVSVYKSWYQLNESQKNQARDLDREVRETPSAFEYKIDPNGNVIDYRSVFEAEE